MFERFSRNTMVASGAALLAALGIGTSAIAQSGGGQQTTKVVKKSEVPGTESNAPENSATDGDNVQYTAPGDSDYKQSRSKATKSSGKQAPGADHQFQGQE
jgi:hypothetical protein